MLARNEWIFIGLLVGVVTVGAVTSVGQSVKNMFQSVANRNAAVSFEGDGTALNAVMRAADKAGSSVVGTVTAAGLPSPNSGNADRLTAPAMPARRRHIAYTHEQRLMGAPDPLRARWEELQSACLFDQALDCIVVEATFNDEVPTTKGPDGVDRYIANTTIGTLTVRVADDGVKRFLNQAGSGLRIVSRSTKAEDLASHVADLAGRQKMLEDQRARLLEIQSRTTDYRDLIMLARELSELQASIEDIMSRQRGVEDITERQSIALAFQTDTPEAPKTMPKPPEAEVSYLDQRFHKFGRDVRHFYVDALFALTNFFVFVFPWIAAPIGALYLIMRRISMKQKPEAQDGNLPPMQASVM